MLYLLSDKVETHHPFLGLAHQFKVKEFDNFLELVEAINVSDSEVLEYIKKESKKEDLAINMKRTYEQMLEEEITYFDILRLISFKEQGLLQFGELEIDDEMLLLYYNRVTRLYNKTFPKLYDNTIVSIKDRGVDTTQFEKVGITIFNIIESAEEFKELNDLIRDINGWEYEEPHHDPIMRRQQEKLELHKKKFAPNITLASMWSTVAVGTGYTPLEIGDLTIKQFFELHGRISKFKEFDLSIIASVFGGKLSVFNEELKKIDDTHMDIGLNNDDIKNINQKRNNQKIKEDN